MLENIILIRNIFYKLFLIGLIFYIFTIMFFMLYKEWSIAYIVSLFNLTRPQVNFLIADFIGWSKMFITFLFLIPALAFHWTGYSLKKAGK